MKRILIIVAASILLLLLVGLLISTNVRLSNISDQIDIRDTALRSQIDLSAEDQDKIKQAIALLGQDSNFFRQYLQMPPQEYPLFDEEEKSTGAVPDNNALYFSAVQTLLERKNSDEVLAAFSDFLASREIETVFKELDLTLKNHRELRAELWKEENRYYNLQFNGEDSKIELIPLVGEPVTITDSSSLNHRIMSSLAGIETFYKNLKEKLDQLSHLENSNLIKPLLKEWNLELSDLVVGSSTSSRTLEHPNGPLLRIGVDRESGKWIVNDQEQPDNFDMVSAFKSSIESFEFRSTQEILTENGVNEIKNLQDDQGFKTYLESLSLSLSENPREDLYYIYFDLLNSIGETQGSFAVQKNFGDVYLMDEDDITITSLKTLGIGQGIVRKSSLAIPEDLPTLAPLNLGAGDKTFLLIGANEANTDTLMVVHLSGTTGKGTIISIPRDLYYKGRKINNIYPVFGPEQLKKSLSEITGLPIQRYMYIDMFAFADVVDILGGIDITLTEPLIDPTYVVKDNGKWSTLNYAAGDHHLGGVESLRVARSRHTTNDFGRAARQQMILESIKNRISELNAGSITMIDDLIDVLMNYVKTDFSVFELLNLFLHHKDAEIDSHVLSWDNVLYHSYSNTYLLDDDVVIDENFNKGSWIMLPLKNDWNVIKWFIRDKINKG